jgi:hypothetical protein
VNSRKEENLEKLMSEALRGLPLRRAPLGLESRVLDELQRRSAQVWWRRSFTHWPTAARTAFVLLNIALVAVTFLNGFSNVVGGRSFSEFTAMMLMWMRPFLTVLSSVGGLTPVLLHSIPQGWLYAGLAVSAVLYTALFGLGAAAYRTLYLRPSMVVEQS